MIEINDIAQIKFDYALLDVDTRVFVQEKAHDIHARLKRTAEDVFAIGLDLIAVQEKLARNGYGCFQAWIDREFGMTPRTVYNFINIARKFDCEKISQSNFPVSVLYALAAPSTPDIVVEQVEAGEIPATIPSIREAKRELQQEQQPVVAQELQYVPDEYPQYFIYSPVADTEYYNADVHREAFKRNTEETSTIPPTTMVYAPSVLASDTTKSDVLTALQSSDSNEWYTPAQYVEAARELMGIIDLDPASCEMANETIQASTYYDIGMNGLDKDWTGHVWLNPPYGITAGKSNQEIWSNRLVEQFKKGITKEAVLLVNANTEAKWFQPLYDYPICFTDHRIRFYNVEGESSQPTQGNALVYFGSQERRFIELFSRFGAIVRRVG